MLLSIEISKFYPRVCPRNKTRYNGFHTPDFLASLVQISRQKHIHRINSATPHIVFPLLHLSHTCLRFPKSCKKYLGLNNVLKGVQTMHKVNLTNLVVKRLDSLKTRFPLIRFKKFKAQLQLRLFIAGFCRL